jgi:AraC-like DNA-binding protein
MIEMNDIIFMMLELSYVLIFGIFGLLCLFLSIPKEKGIEYYKRARKALGIGLCMIAFYCTIRLALGRFISEYLEFWLLVLFTLFHSWCTYATLLYLLETPKYQAKHFFIDGIIPITLITLTGFIGLFYPSSQNKIIVLFGCIFGLKCVRMFFVCYKEYRNCEKELVNYYDVTPDIKWIKSLMYISVFMSAFTIVSFYVKVLQIPYFIAIPLIYTYIVIKVLNFMPRKIEEIRAKNLYMEKKKEEKETKTMEDKIGHKVEKWVDEKKFCQSELTIKDVALQMGTNQSYLSSYLNNNIGMTFQVWLNTLRVDESKVILVGNKETSIEEVGSMVGIPQSYNFSRWFKIVTGTTPYKYRKHNLG